MCFNVVNFFSTTSVDKAGIEKTWQNTMFFIRKYKLCNINLFTQVDILHCINNLYPFCKRLTKCFSS